VHHLTLQLKCIDFDKQKLPMTLPAIVPIFCALDFRNALADMMRRTTAGHPGGGHHAATVAAAGKCGKMIKSCIAAIPNPADILTQTAVMLRKLPREARADGPECVAVRVRLMTVLTDMLHNAITEERVAEALRSVTKLPTDAKFADIVGAIYELSMEKLESAVNALHELLQQMKPGPLPLLSQHQRQQQLAQQQQQRQQLALALPAQQQQQQMAMPAQPQLAQQFLALLAMPMQPQQQMAMPAHPHPAQMLAQHVPTPTPMPTQQVLAQQVLALQQMLAQRAMPAQPQLAMPMQTQQQLATPAEQMLPQQQLVMQTDPSAMHVPVQPAQAPAQQQDHLGGERTVWNRKRRAQGAVEGRLPPAATADVTHFGSMATPTSSDSEGVNAATVGTAATCDAGGASVSSRGRPIIPKVWS
jgi:hypothetical protein